MIVNQWKQQRALLSCMIDDTDLSSTIDRAVDVMVEVLVATQPVLIAGNGGSASDALHFSAELVGKFVLDRKALNVICLNSNVSVMTAWSNDVDYNDVFSRQVEAHGTSGALLVVLSTSGESPSIINALKKAKKLGMRTISLTGKTGGMLNELSDITIRIPSLSTPRIQESHIGVYHYMSQIVEERLRETER